MQEEFSNTIHKIHDKKRIVAGVFGVLIFLLSALTVSTVVDVFNKIKENRYIGQDIESKNTIVISETGEVFAKPDLAVVNLTVINEAKTVEKAMAENTERMNRVIEEMKKLNIKEKDLKTASYNIYPRYEYEKDKFGYSSGKRTLVAYEINQSLQVKIRDMQKIGEVIEKGTGAGANDVSSLYFTIDNQNELKKQAREQAVAKVKEKAQNLAGQLGVKLGKIVNFSENYYTPYYDSRVYYKAESAAGMGGEAPEIETGENKISVSVIITYEIY